MIISKTPMRLSFVGGGSDLPSYYRENVGAVLSTSIDKFVYVTINKRFEPGIRLSYSKTEEVERVDEIEHRIVKATLKKLGVDGGVEITSVADIPSRGSGLGSSSSFTVGLLHALYAYLGQYRSKLSLGEEACEVEIDLCGEPIGKQDQYAAAAGGLNIIKFFPDNSVTVEPVIAPAGVVETIESELLMFYTGIVRSASGVLKQQSEEVEADPAKKRAMRRMTELVEVLRDEISRGNAEALGEILHENWMLKKGLTDAISSAQIDDNYEAARAAGARGGKLLGAGGGGFMVFSAPKARHADVIRALSHMRHVEFGFENLGSSIVFYQ
ncbi:MAG: GHMP kinase [Phenylobacterium sp.]|uniref:GHMP family kinase ATP-binding protein n=1 Tax=Phenylobacterium sp. TaxID=1871053 RepID=UPI0025F8627B|nr:kinase [Phenylobacterium sp.]MBI1198463.1 GHMP kinase [Phenylobacterium sp.]